MNGAMGTLRGYMWPQGADPHNSARPDLQARICVFVEFDDVDLGKDEHGEPRSFFKTDPMRKNW
eukprot:2916181-Pyramimonas_sp.AAC.1